MTSPAATERRAPTQCRTERDLVDWLNVKCPDDDNLQVNVTSFHGGTWYVPDELRSEFIGHYLDLYHRGRTQHLNFLVNPGWQAHPFMDIDFDQMDDFATLLEYNHLESEWQFYDIVRDAFANEFGVRNDAISFCRKPHEMHKFHLICHDDAAVMEVSAMRVKIAAVAQTLCNTIGLRQLQTMAGPMKKLNADKTWSNVPWYDEESGCASFVDVKAQGIRPIGSAKRGGFRFNKTYHEYDLFTRKQVARISAARFNTHFIGAIGNAGNRRVRGPSKRHVTEESLTTVSTCLLLSKIFIGNVY